MCRKLIYLIVLVLGLAGNTMAEDLSIPYWAGAPGSTYAIWEFEDDAVDDAWLATVYVGDEENHIHPESIWYREGTGGDELAAFATWGMSRLDSYEGRSGVVEIDGGEILSVINNYPRDLDKFKRIRIQVTYHGDGGLEGDIGVECETADAPWRDAGEGWNWWTEGWSIEYIDLGGGWWHATMEIDMHDGGSEDFTLNPGAEAFFIFYSGAAHLDQAIIDTICYEGDEPPAGPGRVGAVQATNPSPADGATDVSPSVVLSWTGAAAAAEHDVYFGTSFDDVNDATASEPPVDPYKGRQTDTSYDVSGLVLGTTYYWRIDEVNDPNVWKGKVWSFTVAEYIVVDDMEDYNDRTAIITVWRDGYRGPGIVGDSGANVTVSTESDDRDPRLFGDGPPWPVRGREAMQFAFDNDGSITIYVLGYAPYTYSVDANYYSEAKADVAYLTGTRNWVQAGIKALTLWFYGDAGNDIEPMWVKLTDQVGGSGKVTYGDYGEDPNDLKDPSWQEWNIALSDFGVDLTQVKDISIGFGDESNRTTPGGSGVVFFDDIRLYTPRCILSKRSDDFARVDYVEDCVVDYKELKVMAEDWLVEAVGPGDANLVAWYEFDGDADDSSGNGNHGTVVGDPQWVTGQINGALQFDGTDDYVNIDDYKGITATNDVQPAFSIACWLKTNGDGAMVSWGSGDGAPVGGQYITFRIDGGRLRVEHGAGNLRGNTYVNDGKWHHCALTVVKGGNLRVPNTILYVDGQEDTVFSGSDNIFNLTADVDVSIGTQGWYTTGRFFDGVIDDVRIYNAVLTDVEILGLLDLRTDLHEDMKIDFKDFAVLADMWLDEQLYP